MRVLEHEQEAIAESGAAGLGASKEEREQGKYEVLVVELSVHVGLLLVPEGQEGEGGSGDTGASLQEGVHSLWTPSLCFWVSHYLVYFVFLYPECIQPFIFISVSPASLL
jgi:hypothetical protein